MNNENEVWVDIEGFEGLYQVSSEGRIRSLDREVRNSRTGSVRIAKGKVMKPLMTRNGYLRVDLCKEGKWKFFSVHRLVYAAFNDIIPENMQVNHLNEDKTDNRLENLILMTCKENINFGSHNQRVAKAQSKPVVALDEAGNVVFEFASTQEAGRQGFSQGNISACCRGRHKTHKGLRWKYKEELENA